MGRWVLAVLVLAGVVALVISSNKKSSSQIAAESYAMAMAAVRESTEAMDAQRRAEETQQSGITVAENDVKQEIIQRCRVQMGEYGAAMVRACADQDIAALIALNKYPQKYQAILGRCLNQMKQYGYAMVQACVDQDVEAEKALEKY